MATPDGPMIVPWTEPSFAPECGSCLRILPRHLASTPPDERVALVATLAIEQVVLVGSAQVIGVRGDQADALRSGLPRELRKHELHGITRAIGESNHVLSDEAWDRLGADHKEASSRTIAYALDELLTGSGPPASPPRPDWVIDWNTWYVA